MVERRYPQTGLDCCHRIVGIVPDAEIAWLCFSCRTTALNVQNNTSPIGFGVSTLHYMYR
jgi:hypothetical protein